MDVGRILVVDDTPVNLMLLTSILQGAGHDVRASNSGRRALPMIERDPPDLVMLDVNMPELDGYTLCRELRSKPGLESLPVIFISAHDDGAERARAFEAGGDDYMTKPFEAVEVLARVETHLALRRTRQEAARVEATLDRTFDALCETLSGGVLDARYRLVARRDAGMFRAERVASGEVVTVEILRPSPVVCAAVAAAREGAKSRAPEHPHAALVLDVGITRTGIPYVVTEGLEGRTLRERVEREGRLASRQCADIVARLADVLAAAHAQGHVHGDVRLENVFLVGAPPGETVKLLGFGRPVAAGAADPRADVHALGRVLYELLSGETPNGAAASARERAVRLLETSPALPSNVAQLVALALDEAPARRPSLPDLSAALAGIP